MSSTFTQQGIKTILNRAYGDDDQSKVDAFKVGQNQATPVVTDTDLTQPVPISNGTVNDNGDNTLTGSSGGDNSTDNITTFKPGAGLSDDTSQNLIANNTNVTKIWTIANLAALGTNITQTQPFGLWFYINDAADLAKFKTSGTVLEIKLGSAVGDYFSLTKEASDLAVGWNWITSGFTNVEDLTETGTVAGNVDTFIIEVTTNNSTDEFAAGDVLYDLLRQWAVTDLTKTFDTGYPLVDETARTVQTRGTLSSVEANGFNLSGFGTFNQDTIPLIEGLESFDVESKGDADQFIYTTKSKFVISQTV